ncbi:ankyrin repeat domain-containing protein [Providencia sp. PROV202]|uniref:ankyrin repeat domain-containing protein n=1 Tax=Providencia sp. PROV202 TaxID=2949902 RepID=UPI003FA74205
MSRRIESLLICSRVQFCKYENISSIESMIADVFDIDAEDTQGITGLIVAAAENRPDVVKLRLKHKADTNIKSKLGVSALMFASARGSDIEIVQGLIVM